MRLEVNKLYVDNFTKPSITLKYIGRRGGIERFVRVDDHPAVDGGVIDYKPEDVVYLKPN